MNRRLPVLILSFCLIFFIFLVRHDNSTAVIPRKAHPPQYVEFQIFNSSTRSIWSIESLKERLTLWTKSLSMVKEAPLLGVGLGQWKIALPLYGRIEKYEISDRGIKEIIFQRPHNDYVWVLSEIGVLGLTFYLSIYQYFTAKKGQM